MPIPIFTSPPAFDYPASVVTLIENVNSVLPGLPASTAGNAFARAVALSFKFPQDSAIIGIHFNSQIFSAPGGVVMAHVGILQESTPQFSLNLNGNLLVSHLADFQSAAAAGSTVHDTYEWWDSRTGIRVKSGERVAIFITYLSVLVAFQIGAIAKVFYVPTAFAQLKK